MAKLEAKLQRQLAQLADDPNFALGMKLMAFRWKPHNCYEDAMNFVFEQIIPGTRLVHAICRGTGGEMAGLWGGHAWGEADVPECPGFVWAFSRETPTGMDAAQYRAALKVKDVQEYTLMEMCGMITRTNHCGPWVDSHHNANLRAARCIEQRSRKAGRRRAA
jgi:hypothetical protein